MTARRCSMCSLLLPPSPDWKECPSCGDDTDIFPNAEPTTTEEEATSILRHREFEEYVEKEGA